MEIEVLSNYLALAIVAGATMMSIRYYNVSKKGIPLLILMMLSNATFGLIPEWINDILYDLVYIYVSYCILFKRMGGIFEYHSRVEGKL